MISSNAIYLAGFATSLIALPFFLGGIVRCMRPMNAATASTRLKGIPLISGLLTIAPILAIAIIMNIARNDDRVNIINGIRSIHAVDAVLVNGKPANDPAAILAAVQGLYTIGAHHSHLTEMIRLEIRTGGASKYLTLGRDSQYPQEYWVFYGHLFAQPGSELGRISNNALDAY